MSENAPTATDTPSIEDLCAKADLDHIDPDITSANFPETGMSSGFELLDFDYTNRITIEEALNEINERDYRPINMWELAAFAPSWDHMMRVAALGSLQPDGRVGILERRDNGSCALRLVCADFNWFAHYRFAVIRKQHP